MKNSSTHEYYITNLGLFLNLSLGKSPYCAPVWVLHFKNNLRVDFGIYKITPSTVHCNALIFSINVNNNNKIYLIKQEIKM